jgi:hypothetical protein
VIPWRFKPDQIVRAPCKNKAGRFWWVRIVDVSDCRRFVKVKGGKASGRAYWIGIEALQTKAEVRDGRRRRKPVSLAQAQKSESGARPAGGRPMAGKG